MQTPYKLKTHSPNDGSHGAIVLNLSHEVVLAYTIWESNTDIVRLNCGRFDYWYKTQNVAVVNKASRMLLGSQRFFSNNGIVAYSLNPLNTEIVIVDQSYMLRVINSHRMSIFDCDTIDGRVKFYIRDTATGLCEVWKTWEVDCFEQ